MIIKPTISASRRTRNRISEHGRHGFLLAASRDGRWLLRSRSTKWLGWLPFLEFEEVAR